MPKIREFKVTLYPAHKERGFITTKFSFGQTYPNKLITAAGMPDLVSQVTTFANEHGEGCRASVTCVEGRKPPGFDKTTEDLYFNLKELDPTA